MNSKQERQGNQSAASVSVPRRKGEWIRIRGNSNDTQHVLASSRPSYRPRYPAIRNAMRHASPIFVYSLLHLRLVFSSRSISSRRASRLYTSLLAHAVFVMSSRRVLLVGSYSPPSHHPAVEHGIAIAPSALLYISLYPCILVSLYLYIFYIHRIHHIHYIHQSTSHATITKQAAVPPPVPFASNRISGTRQERCRQEQEAGDDEPSRDTARLNAPQP